MGGGLFSFLIFVKVLIFRFLSTRVDLLLVRDHGFKSAFVKSKKKISGGSRLSSGSGTSLVVVESPIMDLRNVALYLKMPGQQFGIGARALSAKRGPCSRRAEKSSQSGVKDS